jgi:TP901 family phage tail tape measure protein
MSDATGKVQIEIGARNTQLRQGLSSSQTAVKQFTESSKRQLESLRNFYRSTTGKLAGLGAGIGLTKIISDSYQLDRGLVRVRQTASATVAQQANLRKELFTWASETGNSIESLKDGFDSLVASGQSWSQATSTMDAINTAMSVTGADAKTLASALTVASTAFDFDLSNPKAAMELLDKMTMAGRLGNAELEDLAGIFSRIGVNARAAGMSYDKTLAFSEALSKIEQNPERLSTLADSTLRIFTNASYMKAAQKATGVKFFDEAGSRRDAMDVLKDLRAQYTSLGTDLERTGFLQKAFGKVDLDTIKGLRSLLSGGMIADAEAFAEQIRNASGTLKSSARETADQIGRLKAKFREAGDAFAQPVNKAIRGLTKFALDKAKMSGGEMLAVGAGVTAAAWLSGRLIKGAAGRFLGGAASTAVGVAEGKAIEQYAGVQPVFVVNMKDAGGGILGNAGDSAVQKGLGGIAGKLGKVGAMSLSYPALAALAVAGGLYGAYKINQKYIEDNRGRQDIKRVDDERKLAQKDRVDANMHYLMTGETPEQAAMYKGYDKRSRNATQISKNSLPRGLATYDEKAASLSDQLTKAYQGNSTAAPAPQINIQMTLESGGKFSAYANSGKVKTIVNGPAGAGQFVVLEKE